MTGPEKAAGASGMSLGSISQEPSPTPRALPKRFGCGCCSVSSQPTPLPEPPCSPLSLSARPLP